MYKKVKKKGVNAAEGKKTSNKSRGQAKGDSLKPQTENVVKDHRPGQIHNSEEGDVKNLTTTGGMERERERTG